MQYRWLVGLVTMSVLAVVLDGPPIAAGNYSPRIGFATNIDTSAGMVDPNTMLDHPYFTMSVAVNP